MPEVSPVNVMRELPSGLWVAIAATVVALAIVLHAIFPRYNYQLFENGRAMVIYDRWTGKFQRANYDEKGAPTLTAVLTPF